MNFTIKKGIQGGIGATNDNYVRNLGKCNYCYFGYLATKA